MEYGYELCHHGIKGQKWGVRRFQKKDGSLTPAGKKRYYDTPELNAQKNDMRSAKVVRNASAREYNRAANRYSDFPTAANKQAYRQVQAQYQIDDKTYQRAKLKYDTNREVARIQDKGIEFKNKSKHRQQLEEQYKKLGMNDEQAQAASNNRIRTERILAASAAMTVGACALYIANKNRKIKIDGVIKAGETLQRVEMQDTGGKLHDVFYVAQGKHDMKRYENLLGACRQKQTGHAYMMKLSASKDIKVASQDRCRKTFNDLYAHDAEFRESLKRYDPTIGLLNNSNRQYDRFNQELVGMRNTGPAKMFYDKLKSAGYGAIQDMNDMKYSGYNAKNPLIVFDNSNNNIMVKSMYEMKGDLQAKGTKELAKATAEASAKRFIEKAGPISAAALTTATVTTYKRDESNKYNNQGGTSKWS